jgi:hypothetical protein
MMKIDHTSEPKEFVISKSSEFARVGRKGKECAGCRIFKKIGGKSPPPPHPFKLEAPISGDNMEQGEQRYIE